MGLNPNQKHKPAGSPASTGGQFDTTTKPVAGVDVMQQQPSALEIELAQGEKALQRMWEAERQLRYQSTVLCQRQLGATLRSINPDIASFSIENNLDATLIALYDASGEEIEDEDEDEDEEISDTAGTSTRRCRTGTTSSGTASTPPCP